MHVWIIVYVYCTALFQATECPCDALYTEKDGAIHRIQDAGTVHTYKHTQLHNNCGSFLLIARIPAN